MTFDALCLACVAHEMETLRGGRVQQVLRPGPHGVGLEIYAGGERRYLHLCAAPDFAFVQVGAAKLRRGAAAETPLLLLLRKYVRDAQLDAITLPIAAERLLTLDFRHKQHGATRLHVELLGRAANLILTRANGVILDCLVRVPAAAGAARRVLLPGRRWEPPPPPPGERLSPLLPVDALAGALAPHLAAAVGPLWKVLTAHVAGVSPDQAREAVRRAAAPQEIARALAALWAPTRTGAWEPGVWLRDGAPVGFSPWRPTPGPGAPEFAPRATLSAALDEVLAAREAAVGAEPGAGPTPARDPYAAARAAAARALQAARARVERAQQALAGDEPPPGAAETLRTQAEWLLALGPTLPPGATHLSLAPEQTGGPALHIALNPAQTPVQQAQALFKRAARAARAAAFIPTRRARLQNDLAYLDDLAADLARAQNQPEIAAVAAALAEAGLGPRAAKSTERGGAVAGPRRFVGPDGARILVGRNARQNERITFDMAAPNDLWLHVRGAPGAHVVILAEGRAPTEPTIEAAARLAGYYSSRRDERAVDVVVTERRHVSRAPGGHPGQVLVRHERVLRVAPEKGSEEETART